MNVCICCGARLGEYQNINNEWACGPCVDWETK